MGRPIGAQGAGVSHLPPNVKGVAVAGTLTRAGLFRERSELVLTTTPRASDLILSDRSLLAAVVLVATALIVTMAMPTHTRAAIVCSCNPSRNHDNAARYVFTTGSVSGINGMKSERGAIP